MGFPWPGCGGWQSCKRIGPLPGGRQGLTCSGVSGRVPGKRPLTRPAPAGESAWRGPPSPLGEGNGNGARGAPKHARPFPSERENRWAYPHVGGTISSLLRWAAGGRGRRWGAPRSAGRGGEGSSSAAGLASHVRSNGSPLQVDGFGLGEQPCRS